MLRLTSHAIQRYQERVENIPAELVMHRLNNCRAVQRAVQDAEKIGAKYVKLGTGQRLVIENGHIVTVLPETYRPSQMSKAYDQRRNDNQ